MLIGHVISPAVTTGGSTPSTGGTSGTGTTTSSSNSLAGVATQSASSLQTEFLSLLTTQLENQDPDDPVDDSDMLAQLAQFTNLSETQALNTTETNAAQFAGLTQSASLIGQSVTTTNTNGSAGPSGVVNSVTMTSGVPYLNIGGQQVAASLVTTVSPSTSN